jgi:hypothetical protein
MRSKSAMPVSNGGVMPKAPELKGPRAVRPTKPAVLVPTPSIDLDRKLVSST